jgi:hypothetical protein
MRHLWSFALSLFLGPVIWLLMGYGLGEYLAANADHSDALTVSEIGALLALLVAGAIVACLLLPRLSPVGPLVIGLGFLALTLWAAVNRSTFLEAMPADLLGLDDVFTIPAVGGFAVPVAGALLAAVASPRRWRRFERPVAYPGVFGAPGSPFAVPPAHGFPTAPTPYPPASGPVAGFPPPGSPVAPPGSPVFPATQPAWNPAGGYTPPPTSGPPMSAAPGGYGAPPVSSAPPATYPLPASLGPGRADETTPINTSPRGPGPQAPGSDATTRLAPASTDPGSDATTVLGAPGANPADGEETTTIRPRSTAGSADETTTISGPPASADRSGEQTTYLLEDTTRPIRAGAPTGPGGSGDATTVLGAPEPDPAEDQTTGLSDDPTRPLRAAPPPRPADPPADPEETRRL